MVPRSELKYYIPAPYARLLQTRLSTVLRRDSHTEKNGSYRIRSLYFDDPSLSSYYEKLSGIETRSKWRIRYYNGNTDYIRLEEKRKKGALSFKSHLPISLAAAKSLSLGKVCATEGESELLSVFNRKIVSDRLRPTLFVEYERRAFLYPAGNVRVTLDSDLTCAPFRSDLSHPPIGYPVLNEGEVILEVKFDSFLPPFITELLEDVPKTYCAISKYSQCMERIVSIVL